MNHGLFILKYNTYLESNEVGNIVGPSVDRTAVRKAKDRLANARARLRDLASPRGNYNSVRQHWYEFLLSSNAVFSILEQGAKGFPGSAAWFGRKKHERKVDPLLRYLQHARNADEHGIASVTELDRQKIVMVEGDKPVAAIEHMVGNTGTFRSLLSDSSPNLRNVTEMRIYPDRAKLVSVKDRGVQYDPPSEHLGNRVEDNAPLSVAGLMIDYIERMIGEAETLIQ